MTQMVTKKQLHLMVAVLVLAWFVRVALIGNGKPQYYLNLTRSEPLGIYRLAPCNARMLHAGDLVIMDLPEQAKPYVYGRLWLQPGWPLLKNVGAVAGDEYQITAAAITVNGKNCGPVFAVDGRGRALPRLRGCFKVIDGYFLPLSTFSRSFDGRYFGTAPLKLIRGKAIPILIF